MIVAGVKYVPKVLDFDAAVVRDSDNFYPKVGMLLKQKLQTVNVTHLSLQNDHCGQTNIAIEGSHWNILAPRGEQYCMRILCA